jgi:hypothetical protein
LARARFRLIVKIGYRFIVTLRFGVRVTLWAKGKFNVWFRARVLVMILLGLGLELALEFGAR